MKRREEEPLAGQVRSFAATLKDVAGALKAMGRADESERTKDGRPLGLVAHGLGEQVDWIAGELKRALAGEKEWRPSPLQVVTLTVPTGDINAWREAADRPLKQWIPFVMNSEVRRLAEMTTREKLSHWLWELASDKPPEIRPEERQRFMEAAKRLLEPLQIDHAPATRRPQG